MTSSKTFFKKYKHLDLTTDQFQLITEIKVHYDNMSIKGTVKYIFLIKMINKKR